MAKRKKCCEAYALCHCDAQGGRKYNDINAKMILKAYFEMLVHFILS